MALFNEPREHAANPPHTWRVVKAAPRLWHLTTAAGAVLESTTTRRDATERRHTGMSAALWEKERRWFAGEPVRGWKPYTPTEATP